MKAADFDFYGEIIPSRMCGAIDLYLGDRIKPGSFLMAVLENDLKNACGMADHENVRLLHVYVAFLFNYAPANSWGSVDLVRAWLAGEAS